MSDMPPLNHPDDLTAPPPAGKASPYALELVDVGIGPLQGVSFSLGAGEVLALSGASGSGKSRLMRAIADLDAHQGTIRLGAADQNSMPGHRWRQQVMLVPADSQWWADTVGAHFPSGQDIDWGALGFAPETAAWEVSRLSSGERQRLALMRALAHQPRALLLDEPTANLDADTTLRVEQWLLERIRADACPTLWVSHDPAQIARVANRHLRIRDHRLEACG